MNISRKCLLVISCVASLHITQATPTPGTLLDKIVAYVDSQIILQSELEALYQQYLLEYGEQADGLKCKILDQLITSKVLLSKARQEKIVVEEAIVVQALSERMQYFLAQAGSEELLVRSWGKPIEGIKSELRKKIEEQLMIDKMRVKVIQDISVTPQEVQDFFASIPTQERPCYPAEVVVRQIVRYPKASKRERDTLITQLKALKARLQEGEDFEVIAQAYSQDPSSVFQGGDIGFWRLGELPSAYEAAVLALQPGDISDPVVTQLGVYLVQLVALEENRYSSRHIFLKWGSWDAASKQLTQLRTDILAGQITFEQAVAQCSEDSVTVSRGGLLVSEEREVKILIDDVPSDLYFVLQELSPGAISHPMPFTTADGQEAIRLIFLEEKIAPHEVNLAQDYAKLRQLLLNQKSEEELEKWIAHAKSSTFIRIVPEYQACQQIN